MSWNISSLRKRYPDLHHKVVTEDIDIVCLQECLTPNGKPPPSVPNYVYYDPNSTHTCLMYVKKSLPHVPLVSKKTTNLQYHGITIHLGNSTLNVLNAYAPSDQLQYTDLPDFLHTEPTVLMGDLNTRHKKLGDSTTNTNGRRLISLLSAYEDVQIIGNNEPTHIYGGGLDKCIGFNLSYTTHSSDVVTDLMSDHSPIQASIHVANDTPTGGKLNRRRITVKQEHESQFIDFIHDWYKDYKPDNYQSFHDDLIDRTYVYFTNNASTKKRRKRGQHNGNRQQQCYNDPELKKLRARVRRVGKGYRQFRTPQMLQLYQASLAAVRERVNELRQNAWETYVNSLNQHTSLSKAWKDINIIRGKNRRHVSHPNPLQKSNELITKWAHVSSYDMLPAGTRGLLDAKSVERSNLISFMLGKQHDECDVPYTEWELDAALARGRSTSPGEDGVTYNIIRLLRRVPGNPLLVLYNMSHAEGQLPTSWTSSIVVPIPKPGQPDAFRPISLTSCLCKTFERMVLGRLLYRIREHMSPNINGFTHGKGVHNCITTFLTVHGDERHRYTTFLDLKAAFDIANRQLILYELAKMDIGGRLLHWISGYLTNRRAAALFQGYKSEVKDMQLGTPQGGVLSPTLFNVLMNALLNLIPDNPSNISISYADDILIHTKTHREMQTTLNHVYAACEHLGLIISTDKTKVFNKQAGNRKRGPAKFKIGNNTIDYVSSFKYLGVSVPCTLPAIQQLTRQCTDRLRPLRSVAGYSPHYGANIRIVKTMYLGCIRSLIDYHAPALVIRDGKGVDKLEKMQNKALRIILGCPMSTKVLNMRKELGIPSVKDRIIEVNLMIALRLLRGDPDNIVSLKLLECMNHGTTESKWIQTTATHMKMFGLDHLYKVETQQRFLPPWRTVPFDITIPTYPPKKLIIQSIYLQHTAKLRALEHIHTLQTDDNITQTIYTDGSLNTACGRAGSAIVVTQPDGNIIEKGVRINNWASTLQTELVAILTAIKFIETTVTDSLIITDSLSSLLALGTLDSGCHDLVSEARHKYACLVDRGVRVKLLWIPSHIGLIKHDRVDALAKLASNKDTVEYNLGLSKRTLKTVIRKELIDEFDASRQVQTGTSRSIVYHDEMYQVKHVYGASNKITRLQDVVTARLRLGYKYLWQYVPQADVNKTKCKVCGHTYGHTLEHYVLDCVKIEPFRDRSKHTVCEMAQHFISNGKIADILRLYPLFCT